jgi:SNF2 family DNA or RNA helicase
MDTFGRPAIQKALKAIPFKLVIVDEAHSFKNTDSNRSQALVDFMSFLNTGESPTQLDFKCVRCGEEWIETGKQKFDKRIGHVAISKSTKCPKCGQYCYQQQQHSEREDIPDSEKPCGLVLLTGTPILNRADEYFVPLNLVNPERFRSLEGFRRTWLEQDSKGKYSRVKTHMLSAFKEEVGKYLLRREKEDVFTDLPKIQRNFTLIEPDKGKLTELYNSILDQIEVKLAEKVNPTYWDVADHLMKLRRICGLMKVSYATDFLETCALDSAAKYAIGIHHESVRDIMYHQLGSEKNCYKLSGEDGPDRKDWVMRNWEHSNKQFLIINMLAGGVGMDFHYCDNVLILERQWNAEMEAQFEFRFYNPDLSIKKNPTNIEYVICKGLFDEWMFNLIEGKRSAVGETVYNNWSLETDTYSLRDLLERTVSGRA